MGGIENFDANTPGLKVIQNGSIRNEASLFTFNKDMLTRTYTDDATYKRAYVWCVFADIASFLSACKRSNLISYTTIKPIQISSTPATISLPINIKIQFGNETFTIDNNGGFTVGLDKTSIINDTILAPFSRYNLDKYFKSLVINIYV